MLPAGGNNGWSDEVITTVFLYPRQGARDRNLALSRKTLSSDIAYAGISNDGSIEVGNLDGSVIEIISTTEPASVDLAFDQGDHHFVAWEVPGNKIIMRWYDPLIPGYVTTEIAEGNNPCCQIDDYRPIYALDSDIFLFYQRGDFVFYRMQRDRYLVEYEVPHSLQDIILETCGMGTNLRFTIRINSIDGIVLCAGQTPIRIGNNYVGLNWGEIPWAKSSSNTET